MLLYDIGKRSRAEEILLLEAEYLTLSCIIIGVENSRYILSLYLLDACVYIVLCIELKEIKRIDGFCLPQTQSAYVLSAVSDNRHIIRHSYNSLICKAYCDLVVFVSPAPRITVLCPVVSLFLLEAVNDRLLEKTVLIAYAVAVKR